MQISFEIRWFMNRRFNCIYIILLVLFFKSSANEGMWLLSSVKSKNMTDMRKLGLELSADEIFSKDTTSIKDAIVQFGEGCTGELISERGLLITNYHCGYEQIQKHCTVNNNVFKNGFWATSLDDELPNPGLSISFLIHTEEITDTIQSFLNDTMSEEQRMMKIDEISEKIIDSHLKNTHFTGEVQSFYEGNKFFLFIYEKYNDVRLVGTPPFSIGKFGAETDNWVWPRHTGDFCLFRIYASPDGTPAPYSKDNLPLQSKKYLPLSINGYNKGDFTMTLGYSGITRRYNTSYAIRHIMQTELPVSIKIREARQRIMMKDMLANEKVRIQYADKYYMQSANGYKYFKGQLEELQKNKVIEQRESIEKRFQTWIKKDSGRIYEYADILPGLKDIYTDNKEVDYALNYLIEGLYVGIEFVDFTNDMYDILYMMLHKKKDNFEDKKKTVFKAIEKSNVFFKDYNWPTDKKFTSTMLEMFHEDVNANFHPDIYDFIDRKYKDNFTKYADHIFKKSIFVNQDNFKKFLEKPKLKKIKKDPGYMLANSVFKKLHELYFQSYKTDMQLNKIKRLYVKGLMEMDSMLVPYPDANSTMRLSYGTIEGYSPADAVHFNHQTTMKGIMEKKDHENWEYDVPEKLVNLYEMKNFGQYSENNEMPVSFISTNDITGGNSGSPVLNAKGELIGIAYDGNWEAMSSDIMYNEQMQRCINVDIRYVLFIIDKFAGSDYIMNELHIRKE